MVTADRNSPPQGTLRGARGTADPAAGAGLEAAPGGGPEDEASGYFGPALGPSLAWH